MIKMKDWYFLYKKAGKLNLRNKLSPLVSVVFFATLFLLPNFTEAATYYVSASGSATWANSTNILTPCSLSTANENAEAGDLVYLRAGEYTTSLNPTNSGSSGNPIIFAASDRENVYLENSSYGIDLRNGQDWLVFDGFKRDNPAHGFALIAKGADDVELKNCHFSFNNSIRWWWINIDVYSDRWHVHHNIFDVISRAGDGSLLGIGGGYVNQWSSGNHIHDNSFIDGNYHDYATFSRVQYSVIKNNKFYNTGLGDACSDGGGGLQEMLVVKAYSRHNLFEGNIFYETGSDINNNCTVAIHVHNSIGNIFRKNIAYKIDGWFIDFFTNTIDTTNPSEYNTIYNNTAYGMLGDYSGSNSAAVLFVQYNSGLDNRYNYTVNNILSNIGQFAFKVSNDTTGRVHDNEFYGNWLYSTANDVRRYIDGTSYTKTISDAESFRPSEFYDNSADDSVEAKLTAPSKGDMTLQFDSPCIDAGSWLTTITSATGSGKTFTVGNPYFFFNGFGISGLTGDVIRTEYGRSATITSVNYSTGQITVNSPITWTSGEGIGLDYNGSRPDIGAKEYLSNLALSPSPPQGLAIISE